MSTLHDRTSTADFPLLALAGAAGGALLGALAWAAICYVTGYEIGYVAWGIGLLVGFMTVRLGGRGTPMAAAAAGLTLVSIFAGKVLSTRLLVEKELAASADTMLTRELYDDLRSTAADWAALPSPSDADVRLFMVEHAYSANGEPDDLSRADVAEFRSLFVPTLEQLAADQPSYEEWRQSAVDETRAEFEADTTLVGLVVGDLSAIDIVFGVLAVTTALGLVKRAGDGGSGSAGSDSGQELRRAA